MVLLGRRVGQRRPEGLEFLLTDLMVPSMKAVVALQDPETINAILDVIFSEAQRVLAGSNSSRRILSLFYQ